MRLESSDVDLKQRSPLLAFYLCAVAFVIALALTGYLHSAWREVSRAVTFVIAAFAVWSFCRLSKSPMNAKDAPTTKLCDLVSIEPLYWFLFLEASSKALGLALVSWGGILALQLIAWSVGLILFSWRYR